MAKKKTEVWGMLIAHTFSPADLGRSINVLNFFSTELMWHAPSYEQWRADNKIKLHANQPWLGKIDSFKKIILKFLFMNHILTPQNYGIGLEL